jgi:hypothetical protein
MSLCPNPSGALIINSFDLETECSTVLEPYTPLWTVGALVESEPVHISGRPGDVVFAPEIGSWEFSFSFVMVGEVSPTGDVFDDPWVGLESNMNLLNTQFLMPIASNSGLQPATLVMPSGEQRHADVLMRPPKPGIVSVGDNGTCSASAGSGQSVYARYTFAMFIPSGLFV